MDLIKKFASRLPTLMVYHMLGIPAEDIGKLDEREIGGSTSRNAAENSNT